MIASHMFALKPAPALSARRHEKAVGRTAIRKSIRVSAMSTELVQVGEAAAAAASMYFMMSYNEYITHRYYQHDEVQKLQTYKDLRQQYPDTVPQLDGGGHVEHHAETLDDMLLRTDDRWLASQACARLDAKDPWRGTAFSWEVTAMMTAQMAPQVYPWYMLAMGWNFTDTTLFFLPAMLLHALIWNALHPNMHGLDDVPASVGAPSWVLSGLRGSAYFDWLYDNHAGHHVSGGKTNYNVACPLFDHIVGTFQTKESWEDLKANKAAVKAQKVVIEA
ncbi:hypothetical protein CYMTET_51886 [Cymbomonas tetramitiformis]|uniref:Uncharacterized protein n=1 Tax=Cymbomonas tetramitiformis TaxID=36881 RepID=A0AAE0ET87_9CHLO|nr:hypothetical protein CYMTET_51886 [Cymbomonas tetramitiformis]